MTINFDKNQKTAEVWLNHDDQANKDVQDKLNDFIADCRVKKIFVCVFFSGNGDILENSKALLSYNYNNTI